jgi:diguanylate cyclase (GGDEF)-like protein/PAS domain S-box-containing protein
MTDKERIHHLEEQVLYLLEEKRAALSALEMAATLGNFETSLNQLDDPTVILHETATRVRTLVRLKAVSFFLVDEDDSRFYQAYSDPASRSAAFEREVDALIEDKTFAWSLGRNKAVMVTSLAGEQLMLHALSTSSRTRGIFLGVLDQDKSEILDTSLMLLTVILLSSAHALESFELYRRNRETARELEQNLVRLRASEAELKRYQETLEEQVRDRTAALAESNEQLTCEIRERKASEILLRESEAVIHALLDASTEIAVLLDTEGTILAVNQVGAERLGRTPDALLGMNLRNCLPKEVLTPRLAAMAEARKNKACLHLRDVSGGRHYDSHICPVFDSQGQVARLAVFARDITRELTAEEEIRKLSQAVVHSPTLIIITDAAGNIEYVNPKFTQVTGYPLDEAVGKRPSILKSGRHGAEFYAQMWRTIAAGQEWRGEICNRTKDGREYWAMTSISPITGEDGQIRHYVGVAEDITKKIIQEEHIKFLALHDSLTGLPNRNLFMDRLAQAISFSERHKTVAVVMYVDLDDFKQVNDQHGHAAGDLVLQEAARRLTRCIRTADSVARVGGDEFVIILQDIREEREIELVAKRVLERFEEPFPAGEAQCTVGASIGIALCPEDGRDVDTLLRKADMAMYAIKHGDKQGYRYFRDSEN